MSLLRQLGSEIYSMFAGDAVMSIFIVAIVAIAAAARFLNLLPPNLIGFGLLIACLMLLAARVFAQARNTAR